MNIIIASTIEDHDRASALGYPVACLSYGVGRGPRLTRPDSRRSGGLMAISESGYIERGDYGSFCADVLEECRAGGFRGVLADFEGPRYDSGVDMLNALSGALDGLRLYVPESYGDHVKNARVMVSSAISGGTLSTRLKEAAGRFGAGRIALELQRVMMDFTLPSPTGSGRPLSREEFLELHDRCDPVDFYSAELCAFYFTYREGKQVHFVLYDNAGSLRQKMNLARSLGMDEFILLYPEIQDITEKLFGK